MAARERPDGSVSVRLSGSPGTCRDCKRPVVWAITREGKRIPMNRWSSLSGDYVVIEQRPGTPLVGKVPREHDPERLATIPRFICHFDVCTEKRRRRFIATPPRRQHTSAYLEAHRA